MTHGEGCYLLFRQQFVWLKDVLRESVQTWYSGWLWFWHVYQNHFSPCWYRTRTQNPIQIPVNCGFCSVFGPFGRPVSISYIATPVISSVACLFLSLNYQQFKLLGFPRKSSSRMQRARECGVITSVAVSAEISLRPPRKLFLFSIKKYIYGIKVSKNKLIIFWRKKN